MPILEKEKVKIYRAGDAVTATVVNDTIYTAIDAREKVIVAVNKATNAEGHSLIAKSEAETSNANSQTALSRATSALENSETAKALSVNAESNANTAFITVRDLEERANRGEFRGEDGRDGAVASASGIFGFEIIDGHLILSYFGDEEPDAEIVNGELILSI
ncbi:MAG: hypothetical protein FWH03_08245 [Firmicutes bacterium]|nr:hypothetical protein [Bacillota bacterium]